MVSRNISDGKKDVKHIAQREELHLLKILATGATYLY